MRKVSKKIMVNKTFDNNITVNGNIAVLVTQNMSRVVIPFTAPDGDYRPFVGKLCLFNQKDTKIIGNFKYKGDSPNNFQAPQISEQATHVVDLPVWLIKQFVPFCGKDGFRPPLNGVCIGDGYIVATDAHKLFYRPINYNGDNIIFEPKEVIELFNEASTISIFKDGDYVIFMENDTILYQRIIDGNYPNWKAVVPSLCNREPKNIFEVNCNDMLNVLEQAINFANEKTKAATMKIVDNKLDFHACDLDQSLEYTDSIPCTNSLFEEMEIGFNIDFMKIVLKNCSDNVTFRTISSTMAIEVFDKDSKYLIMPVMINN